MGRLEEAVTGLPPKSDKSSFFPFVPVPVACGCQRRGVDEQQTLSFERGSGTQASPLCLKDSEADFATASRQNKQRGNKQRGTEETRPVAARVLLRSSWGGYRTDQELIGPAPLVGGGLFLTVI